MVKENKAIFFDRDGVLIEAPITKHRKPMSAQSLNDIIFCDGIYDLCNELKKKFLLFMVTNQPDVVRKKNTKKNVIAINKFLKNTLDLTDVFVCYSDDEECYNRKPNPGMLIRAKKKYNINLSNSFFVGDRWRDVDAGYNAGCKTIFIDRKYSEKLNFLPNYKVTKISEIRRIIINE